VVPGEEWGKSIIRGITGSRIMVLVFSSSSNDSPQIHREIERAANKGVIIVLPATPLDSRGEHC